MVNNEFRSHVRREPRRKTVHTQMRTIKNVVPALTPRPPRHAFYDRRVKAGHEHPAILTRDIEFPPARIKLRNGKKLLAADAHRNEADPFFCCLLFHALTKRPFIPIRYNPLKSSIAFPAYLLPAVGDNDRGNAGILGHRAPNKYIILPEGLKKVRAASRRKRRIQTR